MDTHYRYEEHFSAFEQQEFLDMEESEGNMGLATGEDIWQWEVERELNGDIAIIPVSSGDIGMDFLSTSPSGKEDCQKILSDWHNLVDVGDNLDWNMFDFTEQKPIVNNNVNRSMGKKIDKDAQCYVVENKPVKVKTEIVDIEEEQLVDPCPNVSLKEMCENAFDHDSESDDVDVDTISEHGTPILEAGDVNSLLEQFEASEQVFSEQTSLSKLSNDDPIDTEKRKEILEALPDELIKRIKANSQRRIVPVIDPIIPSKKRSKKAASTETPHIPHIPQLVTTVQIDKPGKVFNSSKCIQLDHDYCASNNTLYPKHPKKDSGFVSSEEDEQRNILKMQPTVKDASGRLMVSLLKVNMLQNNLSVRDKNKEIEKKKLNLEEYKKRRKDVLGSCNDSKGNSPTNSGSSSPTASSVEDEKSRLLKHQQKLKQMAAEVLKTPPRSKTTPTVTQNPSLPNVNVVPAPTPLLPENIEVKVLVSMGVNTDEVAEIKEIRPILNDAIDKIDSNSLITSVIENIQIKVEKQAQEKTSTAPKEHGEDKTIVYLDKSRPQVSTREVFVQTIKVLPEDEVVQKRSRSIHHRKCYKRRSRSNDSTYSNSSCSSSSSRSRSRSRSPSCKRHKNFYLNEERLREVEERRIVYIGGISSNTTKEDLHQRFQHFGPITNISIHFREYGRDNYGFVTFAYAVDAFKAIENGNDDASLPRYDLCFGGRRIFCGNNYSDLDNVHEYTGYGPFQQEYTFDNLLREAQAKLRKRKSSA